MRTKKYAEQLKEERNRLGLTQAQLAELLGVSKEWVSKVERDLSTPLEITREGALARIERALPLAPCPKRRQRAVSARN